jgi:hypothetical protein
MLSGALAPRNSLFQPASCSFKDSFVDTAFGNGDWSLSQWRMAFLMARACNACEPVTGAEWTAMMDARRTFFSDVSSCRRWRPSHESAGRRLDGIVGNGRPRRRRQAPETDALGADTERSAPANPVDAGSRRRRRRPPGAGGR